MLQPLASLPTPSVIPGTTPDAAAMAFFAKYGAIYGMIDPATELTLEAVAGPDPSGRTFASFTQIHSSTPVAGTRLSMQFKPDGTIGLLSGLFVPKLGGFPVATGIGADVALATARADMTAKSGPLGSSLPSAAPVLEIDPFVAATPTLVYRFVVSYADPTNAAASASEEYEIDARSGAIVAARDTVLSLNDLCLGARGSGDLPASGLGQLGDPKSFTAVSATFPTGPRFCLTQLVPSRTLLSPDGTTFTSDSLTSWDTTSQTDPGSALDAYTYGGAADAWWRGRGRDSYDGLGAPLVIVAHDPTWFVNGALASCTNNAFWNPADSKIHVCPSNGSRTSSTAVGLDVMGHEFTHAVLGDFGFGALGESGAINESLSDIFGQFIEGDFVSGDLHGFCGNDCGPPKAYAASYTTIGEALGSPFRSLVSPHATQCPDNVDDPLFAKSASNSEGGSHAKACLLDNAWLLSAFGGQNQTSGITVYPPVSTGWGPSEDFYTNLVRARVIQGGASIADFGKEVVGSALDFFSVHSVAPGPYWGVVCAWYAVGVLSESDVKAMSVPIDGNVCGRVPSDAGADSDADSGPQDGGGDAGGDACGSVGVTVDIRDNGAAATKYCNLVSPSEIAAALGSPGLSGPKILQSSTDTVVAGLVVEGASCSYATATATEVVISFEISTPVMGTLQGILNTAKTSLASVGCSVSGGDTFVSSCPAACGLPGTTILGVGVKETSYLQISSPYVSSTQEQNLASLIEGRLP